MVLALQLELSGASSAEELEAPWQVAFYPDNEEPGIVEILLA